MYHSIQFRWATVFTAVTLLAIGCGSDDSFVTSTQPILINNTTTTSPATSSTTTSSATAPLNERESGRAALLQDSLARAVGGTLLLANFTAPSVTGQKTFEAALDVPLQGDFRLKRTPLDDGKFRLDVRDAQDKLRATLIALPTVETAEGFDQRIELGFKQPLSSFGIGNSFQEFTFFGYEGKALLKFNKVGQLLSVSYEDLRIRPNASTNVNTVTPNYSPLLPVNGTLTRKGDELQGTLSYGGQGSYSIRGLVDATATFQSLTLASELFLGQGRAVLNANFDSSGDFSPIFDRATSSPLVNVPLPPASTPAPPNTFPPPPLFSTTLDSGAVASYTAVDDVFTVTLPGGTVRSVPLQASALEDYVQNEDVQIVPPDGARAVLTVLPAPVLPIFFEAQVLLHVVDANGRAIPFTSRGVSLQPGTANVSKRLNPLRFVGTQAGPGKVRLIDSSSNLTGEVNVTFTGPSQSRNGFAYVADARNTQIVRLKFNPDDASVALSEKTAIPTGHQPLELLVSRDKRFILAENLDESLQIFAIDAATGALSERGIELNKRVRGLTQSLLDPAVYFANYAHDNQNFVSRFRFNETSGTLQFETDLAPASPNGKLTALQIGAQEFVYSPASTRIRAFNVNANPVTPLEFDLGPNEFATELLASARPDGNVLHALVNRNDGSGASVGIFRNYPLNSDGSVNTAGSRQIEVHTQPVGLAISSTTAYNGSFSVQAINGVAVPQPPAAPTYLPSQGYSGTGAPGALSIAGKVLLTANDPQATVDLFRINDDGSLSLQGTESIDGNLVDLETVILP